MITIICSICKSNLPLRDFYRHPLGKHGRQNKCKNCHRLGVKANRRVNAEYYLEFDRERAFDPDRVAARKEYVRRKKNDPAFKKKVQEAKDKWIEKNRHKRKATDAVNNAVRDGRLKKPKLCQVCGIKPRRLHGHHDDYTKPLKVRWLCVSCHGQVHRKFE